MGTRPGRMLMVAVATLAVLVAGCGGDDTSSTSGDAGQPEAAQDAAAEGGEAGGGDDDAAPGQDDGSGDVADQRQRIITGSMTLSSDEPEQTAEQVRNLAAEFGGRVASTQLRRNDLGLLAGTITLRVPSDDYDALVEDVAATATEVSRNFQEQDVTDRLRDIDANLRNLRALEEQLLVLLEDARGTGQTEEVLRVFDRISEVRGEIERIEATRADLQDQVALSTLTVTIEPSRSLVARAQQVPEEDRPLPWSPGNQAESAWDTTVSALQGFVNFLIWLLVTVLPVLLVWASPLILAVLAYRWWRRRHPRAEGGSTWGSRPGASGSGGPPPAPTVTPGPRQQDGRAAADADAGDADTAAEGAHDGAADEQEREEVTTGA